MAKEYVFLDEWDVDAPQDAVFNALADARTYPDWWKPVYIEVEGDEPPAEGVTTRQHFKGKLPYTLEDHLEDRQIRPTQPFPGRGGRRPDRNRQVDPGPERQRHGSMSASTGSCMPIGRSSATSPRSCGRSSAGTTTGPRHARRRGCSPTRDLTPHSEGESASPNSLPGACPRSSRAFRASPRTDSSRIATPAPWSHRRARSSGSACPASTRRASSARSSTGAPASGGSALPASWPRSAAATSRGPTSWRRPG